MTSWLLLILSFLSGLALGTFYFGGLWYTVARIPEARRPGRLMIGSFLARTVIVLAGFAGLMLVATSPLVTSGGCLLGFVLARFVLVRRWGPLPSTPSVSR